jgi:hypothetical protein
VQPIITMVTVCRETSSTILLHSDGEQATFPSIERRSKARKDQTGCDVITVLSVAVPASGDWEAPTSEIFAVLLHLAAGEFQRVEVDLAAGELRPVEDD